MTMRGRFEYCFCFQVGNDKGWTSECVFITNVKEKDGEKPERGRRGNAKAVQMLLYGWCCLNLCFLYPWSSRCLSLFYTSDSRYGPHCQTNICQGSSHPLATKCLTRVAILGPFLHLSHCSTLLKVLQLNSCQAQQIPPHLPWSV